MNSYLLAAMKCGRNSLGIEIDEEYCRMTLDRLKAEEWGLTAEVRIEFSRMSGNGGGLTANEEPAVYKAGKSKKAAKRKT
jgi:site-specific DNA-methyltransferase (adenine-specific)